MRMAIVSTSASEVAGQHAEGHARARPKRDRDDGDGDQPPSALQQPRIDVPAQAVGAQQMLLADGGARRSR